MAPDNGTTPDSGSPARLRASAESRPARPSAATVSARSDAELVHELKVYQIELEMQNEALREAQASAEQARDRFVDFYESSPVGYLTIAANGLIADINQTGAALLGRERGHLLTEHFARFVKPESADRWHLHLVDVLKTDEKRTCELELLRGDGSPLHVRLDSLRLVKDGRVPVLRVVLTDISERKQVEAELLAAKTAAESASVVKSRFLAAASHDLRQPIQAIRLFVDSLARANLSANQKHLSRCLEESTQSLADLLNVLLDISKLDAGVITPKPEAIQVETLFRKIEAEFFDLTAQKSLRLKFGFPFGAMAVLTDANLLMSLLRNLIGNAVKYTEKGGILVAIRRRGDQALIQVWDTGSGIAPEHMNSIYEEYFQVDNQERDRTKGLGLGLAIAKRIAGLLETDVVCRSRPGRGSVFEFRLPWASPARIACRTRIEPAAAASAARRPGRHVVLVENDVMVGKATKLALESCGMIVTRYKTAEEALADSSIADADVYICDLRLPGLSGVEFLDVVQRRSRKAIKAVVVTGDTAVNRNELTRSTSWQVLFKPAALSSLLSAIEVQDSALDSIAAR